MYHAEDETAFLNLDVIVLSRSSLQPSTAALDKKVFLITLILTVAKHIASLASMPRRPWNKAQKRVFDLGVQGGLRPRCSEFDISKKAVAAVAGLDRFDP